MEQIGSSFSYTGRRVILRTLNMGDAPLVYAWMQEKFFSDYKPYLKSICSTVSLVAERIQTLSSLEVPFETEFLVLNRFSGAPIGLAALCNIDNINLKAEFSMGFRGGLGTRCVAETLWLIFYYVFFILKFNKLYFYVTSGNLKMLKMLQHHNLIQEGKLRKEILSETGEWMDIHRFCILRQDWTESSLYKRLQIISDSIK
jgi:RimJ/RimL family protein N-acetyltransferase